MRALALVVALALPAAAQGPVITGFGPGGGGAGAGADGGSASAVTVLATTPGAPADGPVALAGRADGGLNWLRLAGENVVPEDAGKLPGAVVAVAVAPGGAGWALDDGGALARVTGSAVAIVARHPGGAAALALSPDGALAATGGHDGAVRVWSTEDGAAVAALEGHAGPVGAMAWGEAGPWSAGWDGTLRGWVVRGKVAGPRGKPTQVSRRELAALAPAPDGGVVVGGFEGPLTLVPAKRKAVTWPERPHPEHVRALAASPDGARALAVLPGEGGVVLLDLADPAAAPRWVVTAADGKPPSAAAFTPDGRFALIGRYDGSLRRAALPAAGGGR